MEKGASAASDSDPSSESGSRDERDTFAQRIGRYRDR
jgi:hypothetical protein